MTRAAAEAAHMSAPDHGPHRSRRFLLLLKGRPHMSQSFGVYGSLSMRAAYAPPNRRWPMILNALVEKLKRRSQDDFKGRHFEAALILQAVSWYLRYPLSYRDIEELLLERPRGGPLHSEPVGAGLRAPDRAPAA